MSNFCFHKLSQSLQVQILYLNNECDVIILHLQQPKKTNELCLIKCEYFAKIIN